MTQETFKTQVDRLKSNYREGDYKEERVALFWRTLQNTPDSIFVEALDDLIANKRSSPMLKEILDAVEESRARDAERRADWARSDAYKRGRTGIDGVLDDLAGKSLISKEFAADCKHLREALTRKEISLDEFNKSMDLLDQAIRTNLSKCLKCIDGLIFSPYIQRCRCLAGQRIDERCYGTTRPDGARETTVIPTISFEN